MMPWTRRLCGLVSVIVLVLIPLAIRSPYEIYIATLIAIYAILMLGLNIALGYAGLVSVAHGAFFGVGAYTTAILMVRQHWNFWATLPVSMAICAAISLLLGVLTLRLRGHYFAIGSLAFGIVISIVIQNASSLTGGLAGVTGIPPISSIHLPGLGDLTFTSQRAKYYVAMVIMLIVMLASRWLIATATGSRLKAIRENTELASAVGINVATSKLTALVISSLVAALSGSLFACFIAYLSPTSASYTLGFNALVAVTIGGAGTLVGPVIGAGFYVILPEVLHGSQELQQLLLGVVLLAVILFARDGIWGRITLLTTRATETIRRESRGTRTGDPGPAQEIFGRNDADEVLSKAVHDA